MEEKRTLVRMDAKGYSDITYDIEYMTGPTGVSRFNSEIRELIEDIINKIGKEKGKIIKQDGDGFLISFLVANDAHIFGKMFHHNFAQWNLPLKSQKHKILYRIGCSTGILDISTYDGCLNTVAYRLEPKAPLGGTLIDSQTYNELSPEFQVEYDTEEIIEGKRDEKFRARRWLGTSHLNKNRSDIVNRILDIPQIPNSITYSFETITLNAKAEVIRREAKTTQYLIEQIEEQEIRMMLIPSGEYGMGSSERKALPCERPQHQVHVPAFLMSQFPITKAQWKVVATWPQVNRPLKRSTAQKGTMNSPVVKISWYDAVEFCDRLSQKTGKVYRLPTEAEWEYACRAGTHTAFHFGITITAQYANYDATIKYHSESQGLYRKQITPVGEFAFSNGFGLFDMHGNVWEWCLDSWHDNYEQAPSNAQVWKDESELRRVLRGGSFRNEPHCCMSSYRLANNASDDKGDNIGFRIVCVLAL